MVRVVEYGPGTTGRRIGTGELDPATARGDAGGVLLKRADVRLGSGIALVGGVLPWRTRRGSLSTLAGIGADECGARSSVTSSSTH